MKHVGNSRFCGMLMAARYQIINSVMGYKQGRRTALAWRFALRMGIVRFNFPLLRNRKLWQFYS